MIKFLLFIGSFRVKVFVEGFGLEGSSWVFLLWFCLVISRKLFGNILVIGVGNFEGVLIGLLFFLKGDLSIVFL